ncbi:cytochrome c1 [Xinfangfangia sp. D13-10-4-6]|uniref:cytochrome c1 n=1 Tax=Pseudogemmobacter hezensis TaxID=2737662 RepID=UPI00155553FD|nr:cytochrome c1 [Pseudogemmobacter hezensis]NPD14282.1 cytochrome c1 [Pseudogemmobacter hezensis]
MFRKIILSAATSLALSGASLAAGAETHIEDVTFSFEGPFGKYDQLQLQRGLQVYTEVCSACHGLKFVPIRTLADEGGPHLPADQVRAYAAGLDEVEALGVEARPREWTDNFPARAGDGTGPDLSLMAKARAGFHGPEGTGINQLVRGIGGPEYIHAILTGYHENPECAPEGIDGYYYNTAFGAGAIPDTCKDDHGASTVPGSWIAMAPPLSDDVVSFEDGSPATVDAIAMDVSAFLMWSAEPKMMDRKQAGFVAVVFLILLSSLLYLTNKKLWAKVKGKTVNL